MKQNKLYTQISWGALAIMAAMGTACSDDFFETSSKTKLDSNTAYSNAATAEQSLIGCYNGLQRTLGDEGIGMYLTSEICSDECVAGAGVGDAKNYSILDDFDEACASGYTDLWQTDWKNYYKAIFRCNQLIVNENTIDWDGDEVAHKRIIGEARGLRGLLYFDLVRLFGNVPLVLEPTEDNVPQADPKDVYQAIFDDFKFAIENIPGDTYCAATSDATDGRMSRWAAEALMARAYLFYTGYYGAEHPACTKSEAIAALEDLIDNSGYDLEENFADLWMPACTKEAEGVSEGNYAWVSTYAGKYYDGTAWKAGQTGISKEFVFQIKCNTTQDYDGNSGGNTFQVFLGTRNSCAAPFATGWGICNPNPNFVSQIDGTRQTASVVDHASNGFQNQDDFNSCLSDSYEYTGYSIKKFAPLCFSDGTREAVAFALGEKHNNITYYIDFPVVRFADVLLMHSELTQTATGLNRVQMRVGKSATGYSEEALRTERAQELAFEGIRYWDMLRYGVGGSYAAEQIAKMQDGLAVKNAGVSANMTFNAQNFTSKKGLMQIPNTEITLSGNVLKQNSGWK